MNVPRVPPTIPVTWILRQVDMLLQTSSTLSPGGFRDALERRAEIYLDLIESWKREHEEPRHGG